MEQLDRTLKGEESNPGKNEGSTGSSAFLGRNQIPSLLPTGEKVHKGNEGLYYNTTQPRVTSGEKTRRNHSHILEASTPMKHKALAQTSHPLHTRQDRTLTPHLGNTWLQRAPGTLPRNGAVLATHSKKGANFQQMTNSSTTNGPFGGRDMAQELPWQQQNSTKRTRPGCGHPGRVQGRGGQAGLPTAVLARNVL